MRIELFQAGACYHPEAVVLRGAPWKPAAFPAIVTAIVHPTQGCLLFDTGYAEHFHAATEPFPERLYRWLTPVTCGPADAAQSKLRALGIAPRDVRYIFISHFHADHIAGLRDFPQARFICSSAALNALRAASRWSGVIKGFLPELLPDDFDRRVTTIEALAPTTLPEEVHPFQHGRDLFGDGRCIAVDLPGHAAGHAGLLIDRGSGRRLFLIGDAVWRDRSITEGIRPHPITALLTHDGAAYNDTIARLQMLQRGEGAVLLPSHCPSSLERARRG